MMNNNYTILLVIVIHSLIFHRFIHSECISETSEAMLLRELSGAHFTISETSEAMLLRELSGAHLRFSAYHVNYLHI